MGTKQKELLFDSWQDVERTTEALKDIIARYGSVTLSDLYDLIGLPSTYSDTKWGWKSLPMVLVVQHPEGKFSLELPPMERLIA